MRSVLDEIIVRIYNETHHFYKYSVIVSQIKNDIDSFFRIRYYHRFVESFCNKFGFGCALPFSKEITIASGIEDDVGVVQQHFNKIITITQAIDEIVSCAAPNRFHYIFIKCIITGVGIAEYVIVDS